MIRKMACNELQEIRNLVEEFNFEADDQSLKGRVSRDLESLSTTVDSFKAGKKTLLMLIDGPKGNLQSIAHADKKLQSIVGVPKDGHSFVDEIDALVDIPELEILSDRLSERFNVDAQVC